MIEKTAKTKWCPHTRVDSYEGNSNYGRHVDGGVPNESKCIASDCMMWVWDIEANRELAMGVDALDVDKIEFEGHCGLIK